MKTTRHLADFHSAREFRKELNRLFFSFLAVYFLWCLPMAAQDTCPIDRGAGVVVQYKVANAALSKCGFEEFTNATPPRIKIFREKTSRETHSYSYEWAGTNGCAYTTYINPGCAHNFSWSDGPFSGEKSFDLDITKNEIFTGLTCNYTNLFTGGYSSFSTQSDGRTNTITRGHCGYGSCNTTIYDSFKESSSDMTPLYGTFTTPGGSTTGWYFLTHSEDFGYSVMEQSGGCGSIPLATYPYSNPITNSEAADLSVWGEIISSTHLEADLTTTNSFTPCGLTNPIEYVEPWHMTVDLDKEYTDGELYTNIMSLMPAYPSDWYTPNGDDFLETCAYSIIHKNHTTGPFAGWGFYARGAELQKMKYRFCVPASDSRFSYAITWDVITYNFSTGAWSKDSGSTDIFGTGGEANSGEYYAPPPDWDQSPNHGFVFRWIENVKVTANPLFQLSSVAGSGPWKSFSHDGGGCGSCAGPSGSGGFQDTGGFQVGFSMGQASNGVSAQSLEIVSTTPSLYLATPAGISYTASHSSIEVVQASSQIRQVKAPQALADIVTLNAFSYEIRYYLPSQVGSLVSGVYQVTGSPFVTWKIENPDASSIVTNRLRLTETRGADAKIYDYTYTAASGSWKLLYPGSLREDEWSMTVTTNGPSTYFAVGYQPAYLRTITNTIRAPGSATQSKVKRVYQQFPWGEARVEETLSPDSNPETTTYAYHAYSSAGNSKPLKLVVQPDGSWKYYDPRDGLGRLTAFYSGFGDTPAPTGTPNSSECRKTTYDYTPVSSDDGGTNKIHTPRTTVEYVQGFEVARRYAVIKTNEHRDIQAQSYGASWDAADNLVTVTKYYTSGVNSNRVQSIERPDGTMTFYEYAQATNGSQTNTIYSGQPDGGKSAIVDGAKEVSILGPFGEMISRTVTDISSGIVLSADTYSNYDSFSRPTRVTHLDGTYEDTQFACCGVDTTTDRDGVVTFYKYDAMKRQTATTRQNITSTNVLDAAGRTVKSLRIGTDASQIVLGQSRYNLAGELTHETNALNGVTSYVEGVDGSGHKVRTTTNPDGGTRIETYYLDGSLLSVTGTAEYPVYYEYGVEWESGLGIFASYTKEIKGSTTGDEWTKTYTDQLGRSAKTIYAAASGTPFTISYYNTKGQMTKQIDPDGVATLYQYNAKGELEYTAVDVDRNGVIDFTGTDRVTRTVSDVLANYGANVRRSRSYVWKTDDANTSTLVSTSESSTDGLRSWNTAWNNGQALTSQSRTIFAGSGYRYSTNIAPDNSYSVSITRYGTNVSATRYDSSGSQLLQMTFAYDAHGRQNRTTDARNGTSTNTFNNADQVVTMTTPIPGAGQSAQTTTMYYDSSLRAWKTVLSDGGVVTNDFHLTGQVRTVSGARTYASGNGFDGQGRLKTLTNWSGFPATGTRTTTWNYDQYRGWLTGKSYPDGTGPSYAYTDAGRLNSRAWARTVGGQPLAATYSYNEAGDLSEAFYSDSTAGFTNKMDRRGRTIVVTNGATASAATFNDVGLLLTESFTGGLLNGLSVTNGYDHLLRRTNLTLTPQLASLNTTYGYDSASRLSSVGAGVNSAKYSYVANSPLVSQIFYTNNGTLRMTRSNQFDNLNRLTNLVWKVGSTNVASFAYQYNNANQRTRVTFVDGSYWLYQYDTLGQVTSAKKYWSDGTSVAGQQSTFDFDDIGNRETTASGGDQVGANLRSATYSANLLNQITNRTVPSYVDILGTAKTNATVTLWGDNGQYSLTSRKADYFRGELPLNNATGAMWLTITNLAVLNDGSNPDIVTNSIGKMFIPKTAETFSYDLDGNLTNDGRWSYTWDAENRATSFTRNSTAPSGSRVKLDCQYDYRSRRTQKIVSTWNGSAYVAQSTNKFVYDGWNLVAILDATNGLVQSFTWGTDASGSLQGAGGVGGLISMTVHQGANAGTYFYCYDGNHNVATLVNATNGVVEAVYELDAFLKVLRATGRLAFVNTFVGSTKFCDWETGFLYYGYRYYDPDAGRWLNRDPIEETGGDNLYDFINNGSVNATDLLGLIIETSCDPIDDYLKSLGISYTRTGNYRYTFSGTDIGTGNASDNLIVTRMLAVGTVFKVSSTSGSATDNLKKHVEARLTIVRNALKANFLFDTHVFKFDREAFYNDPQAYFDKLNNGSTVIACTALSRIIFETGNKHNPQGVRKRSGPTAGNLIWIPGDWGWIKNKGVISKPGYEGENVFHTGKSGEGEMFWGHFKPGLHPAASESWWFDFIRHWPGGGIPEWRDEVSYPLVGLERPTTPQ